MMGKDIERMLTNINGIYNILLEIFINKAVTDDDIVLYKNFYNLLSDDYEKMQHIDEIHFADKSNFNNNIGSPWTEFTNLMKSITIYSQYISTSSFEEMISIIIPQIVDFKFVLITYHDYVQRAFDNVYNDNVPSITFTNDSRGTQSTGNVSQKISNNVSIKDVGITPY